MSIVNKPLASTSPSKLAGPSLPVLVQRSESKSHGVNQSLIFDELKVDDVPKLPGHSRFLQYDIPFFIGPATPDTKERQDEQSSAHQHSEDDLLIRIMTVMSLNELEKKCHQGGFNDLDHLALLDQLFPPQDVNYNNKKWRFYISKTPAGAADRLEFFKAFENESEERGLHELGYCPITNILIQDLFDECIRQEILDNPERGVILVHCRNGLHRIIQAFACLTESAQLKDMLTCTALGVTVNNLQQRLDHDEKEIKRMQHEIHQFHLELESQRQHHTEERKKKATKYHEELEFLKKTCQQALNQVGKYDHSGKNPDGLEEHQPKPANYTHLADVVSHVMSVRPSRRKLL